MKIAIFGDSFAADQMMENLTQDYMSWPQILKQQGHDVTNYAVGGSSMYYSWQLFTQHQQTYDRIIYMITSWDRFFVEIPKNTPGFLDNCCHATNPDTLTGWIKNKGQTASAKSVYQALWDYWILVGNEQQRQAFHRLMLEDIISQRPDALLISGFKPDLSLFNQPNQSNLALGSSMDLKHYFTPLLGDDWNLWHDQYECRRHCHLNRFNNQILAHAMVKWLRTHDVNDVAELKWVLDLEQDWQYYFAKRA